MKNLICLNGDCLLRLENGTCADEDKPKVCNQFVPDKTYLSFVNEVTKVLEEVESKNEILSR